MTTTALYVGINLGKDIDVEPTTGTTSTGKDVEISIRATAQISGITRLQVVTLTKKLQDFIVEGGLSGAGVGVPIL